MKSLLYLGGLLLLFGASACTVDPQASASSSRPRPQLRADAYNVGILVMDGVYNTELTAPYDIFQHTLFREGIRPMNVFTVANTRAPIRSFEGLYLLADYDYLRDALPRIDILVVPSADEVMLDFVRRVGEKATFVTSHCDGAFVLAEAGLLEGVASTTFPADIDAFAERYPDLEVHREVLFVHDGRFITSAGGAKSFEAALYLCEHLYGKTVAQQLAEGLVIDWDLTTVPHLIVP